MLRIASEGSVYRVDLENHTSWHYYLVLNDPTPLHGEFIAASLTDRQNFPKAKDIWETDYTLCPTIKLAKPSVIFLPRVKIWTQIWLGEFSAEYVGQCTADALQRARCNIVWYPDFFRPDVKKLVSLYHSDWKPPCGKPPGSINT